MDGPCSLFPWRETSICWCSAGRYFWSLGSCRKAQNKKTQSLTRRQLWDQFIDLHMYTFVYKKLGSGHTRFFIRNLDQAIALKVS